MTDTTAPQRTPEWIAARLGKVGASRVADIMAKTKSGPSASRANYMAQLIAERLTGVLAESYSNAVMDWGTENEAGARAIYQFMTDREVIETGFVAHPKIAMAGTSPDGLVATSGLVEIKAPNTATHIDTLLGQNVSGKYVQQMQFQMACTGRAWCDFVSYDPRLPVPMQLFIQRVPRDDKLIRELEQGVTEFLTELEQKLAALRARYEPKKEAA